MAASTVSKKISTFFKIAQELRQGKHFNITRLTSLKNLCTEPQAAAQFCLYLARLTRNKMEQKVNSYHLEEVWNDYKHLVSESILVMEAYLANPITENEQALWMTLNKVRDVNNKYEKQSWGPVRIIQCQEVLLIEEAINGILRSSQSSHWGYQIARSYAERYNPSYGTGLLPESAPMVEDIANFWNQYHSDNL